MIDVIKRLVAAPAHEAEKWLFSWVAAIFVPAIFLSIAVFAFPWMTYCWIGAKGLAGYVVAFWASVILLIINCLVPLIVLALLHDAAGNGFDLRYPPSAKKPVE